MKITMIGTGYVGLVSGACFAEVGHCVTCIDVDEDKIAALLAGRLPIYEPGLDALVQQNRAAGRLDFTTNMREGLIEPDVVCIAVGTPALADGRSDLSYIRRAVADIGDLLRAEYAVVATMSTVPVGTGADIERMLEQNMPDKLQSRAIDVVSNPEFLREGSAVNDRLNADRIVIGAQSRRAAERMAALYEPFHSKLYITDRTTAELAKYACNAFLATKISFINEIATICEPVEADVTEIARIMGADPRIGPHFLQAGIGYGGSCFPKDTRALDRIAHDEGHDFSLLKAVIEANDRQRQRLIEKIEGELSPLSNKRLAVLGLAFKPHTDDVRESPALSIVNKLIGGGAVVTAHDPVAVANARPMVPGAACTADLQEALAGADGMVVATDWPEYIDLDLAEARQLMNRPLIFDGRNIFDPAEARAAGFVYYGMGRHSLGLCVDAAAESFVASEQ